MLSATSPCCPCCRNRATFLKQWDALRGGCLGTGTQDCPPGVPLQGGTVRLSVAACHFCVVDVFEWCPWRFSMLKNRGHLSLDSIQQEVLGMTSCLNSQGRCFSFTWQGDAWAGEMAQLLKSTCCSYREPECYSQHPHSVLGLQRPLLASVGNCRHVVYIYRCG